MVPVIEATEEEHDPGASPGHPIIGQFSPVSLLLQIWIYILDFSDLNS